MSKPKAVVLTGGGTAGHVTPNLALLPYFHDQNIEVHYIGTKNGIEQSLISGFKFVKFHSIQSGKLRRYLDRRNFTDIFRVIAGIAQSILLIGRIKPSVIFSKGGFVSVPVCIAGFVLRIPVIIHESDYTPGLANRISSKFASAICTAFPETAAMFKSKHSVHTGTPVRAELFCGNREIGRGICGLTNDKPVILAVGGSLGAQPINICIRDSLHKLLESFNIVHICGKNNIDSEFSAIPGYAQFEYLNEEMAHVLKLADIAVSRSGSNSINEFLALRKPSLLIPLPKSVSRGDQLLNASAFEKKGYSMVLRQENLNPDSLYMCIRDLYNQRDKYIRAMENAFIANGTENVLDLIKKYAKK